MKDTTSSDAASAVVSESKYTPEVQRAIETLERIESGAPRDEHGRFVAAATQEAAAPTPKVKEQPKTQDASRDDAGDTKTKGEPDAEYDAAATSLKRGKVPESAIKAMSREDAIAYAKALSESKSYADGLVSKVKELEKAKPGSASEQSGQPVPGNLRERASKLAELLVLGDDGRQEIESALYEAGQAANEAVTAAAKSAADSEKFARELARRWARSELQGSIPELKDAESYAGVLKEMEKIYASFEDATDDIVENYRLCMEKAAQIHLTKEIAAREQAAVAKREKARDAGQPRTSERPRAIKPDWVGKPRSLVTLEMMEIDGMTPTQAGLECDRLGIK